MLTPILKSKTVAGFAIAYLISALLLLVSYLFQDESGSEAELLLSHWAFPWLENYPMLLGVLGLALVSAAAILSRLRIAEAKGALGSSNLVMVIMVAIIAVQYKVLFSRPDVLMALIIGLAMFLLFITTYKKEAALGEIFHVGLLLGLGCLFVGQSIFYLLALGFSFLILRSGNWKEWVVMFLGLAMAAIFLILFAIWSSTPLLSFQRVIQSGWSESFWFAKPNSGHIVLLLALVVAVIGMFGSLTLGTVTERNISLSNLGWIVSVILMVLLLGLGWQQGLIFAAFPLSVSITRTIERIQRWWIADLVLVAILAAPVVRILWQL